MKSREAGDVQVSFAVSRHVPSSFPSSGVVQED